MDISSAARFNPFSGNTFSALRTAAAEKNQPQVLSPAADSKTGNLANSTESTTTSGKSSDSQNLNKNHTEQTDAKSTFNKELSKDKSAGTQLTEDDLKQVQELKQRDQEVRTHEAAHLAAAGKYATGGASFDYKRGPDGKNYAVGGEVGIDTSEIPGDPQATLQKAQQIRAAAQAPANPSAQDRQVAASATQMESKARQEIAEQRIEESGEIRNTNNTDNTDEKISSDKTGNEEPENSAVKNKAASAYETVDGISQSESSATSLIQLIA